MTVQEPAGWSLPELAALDADCVRALLPACPNQTTARRWRSARRCQPKQRGCRKCLSITAPRCISLPNTHEAQTALRRGSVCGDSRRRATRCAVCKLVSLPRNSHSNGMSSARLTRPPSLLHTLAAKCEHDYDQTAPDAVTACSETAC